MKYFGLDVHTKWTTVAWTDPATGESAAPYPLATDQLLAHLDEHARGGRITFETGGCSIFLARQLKSLDLDVLVVDAARVHPFLAALRKGKNDKNDARGLSELLSQGILEAMAVYVPAAYIEDLRNLTRTRLHFCRQATADSNALRALVRSAGLDFPGGLAAKKTQRWLDAWVETLPPATRECCQRLRQGWANHQATLAALDTEVKTLAERDAQAGLLKTLPGVGDLTALTIVAEIGDIRRFEAAKNLRSYARLTASLSQSGEHTHTGPLDKRGNRQLSRIMVLFAQHFSQWQGLYGTTLKGRYRRCRDKHGANPAKVALARDLCDIVYAMLREGTEFDEHRLPRTRATATA